MIRILDFGEDKWRCALKCKGGYHAVRRLERVCKKER